MTPPSLPVLFIGHGSPENAFELNAYSRTWRQIASAFATPRAIIVISAHWTNRTDKNAPHTSILAEKSPRTIHDFYGFPSAFYDFQYRASGDLGIATHITALLQQQTVTSNTSWGFDHGAWSILAHMYPEANIPTLQLSIDESLSREEMYAIGKELQSLRKEGILILGSGNIVHNLSALRWGSIPYAWAEEFDYFVQDALQAGNHTALLQFEKHPLAHLAHPTVDHFLPLLYILGATYADEKPTFFCETIEAGSIAMRCVAYGI